MTKDHFSVGEYNKLSAKNIGPIEIVEKINPNAYHLRLPSHIHTSDVFNVRHLVSYLGDNFDDDANSRTNSLQLEEIDTTALKYLEARDRCLRRNP